MGDAQSSATDTVYDEIEQRMRRAQEHVRNIRVACAAHLKPLPPPALNISAYCDANKCAAYDKIVYRKRKCYDLYDYYTGKFDLYDTSHLWFEWWDSYETLSDGDVLRDIGFALYGLDQVREEYIDHDAFARLSRDVVRKICDATPCAPNSDLAYFLDKSAVDKLDNMNSKRLVKLLSKALKSREKQE